MESKKIDVSKIKTDEPDKLKYVFKAIKHLENAQKVSSWLSNVKIDTKSLNVTFNNLNEVEFLSKLQENIESCTKMNKLVERKLLTHLRTSYNNLMYGGVLKNSVNTVVVKTLFE